MTESMTEPAVDAPLPAHKSLRAKAWMTALALLAFMVVSALYIARERGKIHDDIQRLAQHEKALAPADALVGSVLVDARAYQRQYDRVVVESLALATLGLLAFGAAAGWFFARLAGDVRRLEAHARQIVRGGRGVALQVRRGDELGRLMQAVNRMASDLDEREKQIEVDGQRRSHQDKMLAVGALAAGIAHEVNNPLAVIAGVAQELMAAEATMTPERVTDGAHQILLQAQRAAQVARHLAEAAAPQPAELDWVDLNALVHRVVQLMGYDRRYRHFDLAVRADLALPAVRSSANAIQQALMQMLSLGCDAMADQGCLPARVAVTTTRRDGMAELSLLFPPVLDFSRSEVQRSLLLCRAVVEPLGARLAFGQGEGHHLRITLSAPSGEGDEQG
jgi:signal transduction histidine kinase